MTPERLKRFREVVRKRQPDLAIILENVHDLHNIGAVMRSCDSVGVYEVIILQTDKNLQFSNIAVGKRTSAGTRRWMNVLYFTDREECFAYVKTKYKRVLGTHLSTESRSLYELDLSLPTALFFGNEHEGISEESLKYCDGNFIIPQAGMVQSLNISVACAVSLYEAFRQRSLKGFYTDHPPMTEEAQHALLQEYITRHEEHIRKKKIPKTK